MLLCRPGPPPPGLWLPAEGEMLPGSSRFAADAVMFISVFTPTSLRASSLRHSPPSAGSVERSGCLSSCWPQADPHDPRVIAGIQCCGGPETTNDAARARRGVEQRGKLGEAPSGPWTSPGSTRVLSKCTRLAGTIMQTLASISWERYRHYFTHPHHSPRSRYRYYPDSVAEEAEVCNRDGANAFPGGTPHLGSDSTGMVIQVCQLQNPCLTLQPWPEDHLNSHQAFTSPSGIRNPCGT